MTEPLAIRPQPLQERALACEADIVIMGGAAFAGKTMALLLEPLYHVGNPGFGAVYFRRTYGRITQEGGMWDESQGLYRPMGAEPNKGELLWTFPSGAALSFAHMQYEDDKYAYYGSQICLLGFDQLEEFSEGQFFYMLGRNRSGCGVRPYCRANCNPDPDSWLVQFLGWWIDEETGNPIPARAGKTRYFVRLPSDELAWADTAAELYARYGQDTFSKSVTFFPGTMDDNPLGRARDPAYEANLMVQPGYMRQRLRYGNWKARPTAGQFFQRHWFDILDAVPPGRKVRFWDLAATEPSPSSPDPDYTVGVLEIAEPDGYYTYADVQRARVSSAKVETMILHTAAQDGPGVEIGIEQEPGASGKITGMDLARKLAARGFRTKIYPKRLKTELAAGPLSSAAELGLVRLVRGPWNKAFLDELADFPGAKHDDQLVGATGSHSVLTRTIQGQVSGAQFRFRPVGR